MNEPTIKNFIKRCKKERGFIVLAVYFYFVTNPLDLNSVETVIHNNGCGFPGGFTTVKHFIKFLLQMKTCIKKVLGSDYKVKVYNSLYFWMSGLTINTPLNFVRVMN